MEEEKLEFEDGVGLPLMISNPTTSQGTKADKTVATTITEVQPLTPTQCHNLHFGNVGLLKKYILRVVDDCFRKGYEVEIARRKSRDISDILDDDEMAMFRDACEDSLWSGAGFIRLVGENDGEDVSKPLDSDFELANAYNLSQLQVRVASIESNQKLKGVGKPLTYRASNTGFMTSKDFGAVHNSRMLVMKGYAYDTEMIRKTGYVGESVYNSVYITLNRWKMGTSAALTLLVELSTKVMKIKDLASKKTGSEKGAFTNRIRNTVSNLSSSGMVLMDTVETLEFKGPTITGTDPLFNQIKDDICADLGGAPRILLFGESPSGISTDGESGWNNHYNQVRSRQINQVIPAMKKYIALKLKIDPKKIKITANPLKEISDKDAALINFTNAQAEQMRSTGVTNNPKPASENTGLNADDSIPAFTDSDDSPSFVFFNTSDTTNDYISKTRERMFRAFGVNFVPTMKTHLTVIHGEFSDNDVKAVESECEAFYKDCSKGVYTNSFKMFYNPKTNQHCLVLLVDSYEITKFNETLQSVILEGKVSRRDYVSHITIGYATLDDKSVVKKIERIEPYGSWLELESLELNHDGGTKIWK